MASVGRNGPCPCGSGRKAKRCCGVARGPSEEQMATAYLRAQVRAWVPLLAGGDESEVAALLKEAMRLPTRVSGMEVPLPRLLPPALERSA